jgi:3-phenylpropionate/trans-cinnamate dioxygenase ferredoxin reductase subunit
VIPRTRLADAAGAKIENGIGVNQQLRTTLPNVFAAGAVANAWHPFYKRNIRVEHWADALNQGPAAAQAMLGHDVSYDRLPYFSSDQYEIGMQYSGYATEWDEIIYRGASSDGEFIAFWIKDQRVIAGMNVNVWDVNEDVQRLIRSRQEINPAALRDQSTPTRRTHQSAHPSRRQNRPDAPMPSTTNKRLRALQSAGRLDLARHALTRASTQRSVR